MLKISREARISIALATVQAESFQGSNRVVSMIRALAGVPRLPRVPRCIGDLTMVSRLAKSSGQRFQNSVFCQQKYQRS